MVSASYDTDLMRRGAGQLTTAADELKGVIKQLATLPHGAFPHEVAHALDELSHKARKVSDDFSDHGAALADNLNKAAERYDLMDQSLVETFRTGG